MVDKELISKAKPLVAKLKALCAEYGCDVSEVLEDEGEEESMDMESEQQESSEDSSLNMKKAMAIATLKKKMVG